jgi:hypothetical protein
MKGKLFISVIAIVMVLGLVLVGTTLAQGPQTGTVNGAGLGWVDENGDGICDHVADGTCLNGGNGTGLRDGSGYRGMVGQSGANGAGTMTRLRTQDGTQDGTCPNLGTAQTQQRLGANGGQRGMRTR